MRYILVLLILFTYNATAEEPIKKNLVMGFVPSRSIHEIQLSSEKIAAFLSKETGYNIRAITLSNYAGVAVGMKTKRVDFAFVGPLNYLVIDAKVGATPLTVAIRSGVSGYRGLIIVNRKSGIRTLSDLRGKRVAFGDTLSASGSLYPKAALINAGIDPRDDIRSVNLSSQSAIVMSVVEGKVDAGAIYDGAQTNPEILKYHPDVKDTTMAIYQSEMIPGDPQIARIGLNKKQTDILRSALIKLGKDDRSRQWLKDIYGIDSLVSTSKEEYRGLLSIVKQIDPSLLTK